VKTVNSVVFATPQFSLLSDSQLQDLHLAALEVLRRTGVQFHHQEALEMLKAAGAFVSNGNLVKFPAAMVEEAIASAPGRIILCDREGEAAVWLEGSKVWFGTGSDYLNLLDPETGQHRKFTQADLVNGYRLCDALSNIHFVMSIGIPADVDPDLAYDVQMALMLEHTTKPRVFVTNDGASCQRAIDMAAAVAGGPDEVDLPLPISLPEGAICHLEPGVCTGSIQMMIYYAAERKCFSKKLAYLILTTDILCGKISCGVPFMVGGAASVQGERTVPGETGIGTLKNQIYTELRRSIIMGHRLPGERIDIRQIAQHYGTSITPVREALQMLNQEGLVTIRPHSGYLVTQLTLKQLRDLFDLREILELAAAERAARKITPEQLGVLEGVSGGYTGDDDESYARYTAENRRFHTLIAQATGNHELAEMLGNLHDRLARFMVLRYAGEMMHHSHARIIKALRAHDMDAARQAMLDELNETREIVLDRVIQEQGNAWHLIQQRV
jgi:DNA-binding GntR family transcriptional regulator